MAGLRFCKKVKNRLLLSIWARVILIGMLLVSGVFFIATDAYAASWVDTGYPGFKCGSILLTGTDGKIWAIGAAYGVYNGYGFDTRSSYWNGSSWVSAGIVSSDYWNTGYWTRPAGATVGKDGKIWVLKYKETDGENYTGNYYVSYWNGSSWVDTGQIGPSGISASAGGALTTGADGTIWARLNGQIYRWNGYSWVSSTGGPEGWKSFSTATGTDGKSWKWGYDQNGTARVQYWNGSSWVNTELYAGWQYGPGSITVGLDGKIWASVSGYNGYLDYVAYYTSDNTLSLVPSPNGATGQLVLNPRTWGSQGVFVALEGSNDGVNFTSLGIPGAGTISVTPTSNTYYVRAVLTIQFTPDFTKTFYSNVVSVPTIINAPTVTQQMGIVTWDQTRGRSWIKLNWNAVSNASGYKLYVFDGNQYQVKDLGNLTSWDSRTSKIFPFPNELPENNSISTNLFHWDGSGTDFEDTAKRLYRTTTGISYDSYNNYWFRVTAYNQWMETNWNAESCIVAPQLPNATDGQQPTGSVNAVSQEGLKKTYNTGIKVTVNAQDNLSGVRRVELSNDGVGYTIQYEAPLNPDNGTGIASYSNTFDWDVSPGAGTKVIYVRITDAVGNQKVVTDSIALADDVLPPSVTLSINNGASSTTSASVTLTITATDNSSVPSQMQMRLSNNGTLWSPWQAYQQTITWDITNASYGGTSAAGTKNVYVEVADAAQNYSMATASIGYNPSPPTGTVNIVGAVSGTYNGQQAWFTNSNDLILNLNFSGAAKIRTAVNGMPWSEWQPYSTSFEMALPVSQGLAVINLQVADAYGVVGQQQTLRVLIDSQPPVISKLRGYNGLTATSSTSVNLEIQASDNLPGALQYQYQVNGGAFSSWANLSSNTISVSGLANGANNINVNVKDQAGNIASASTTIFKI